ncbi:GTP-dependent dephospho-CoA kinase family protein [Natrialbaceae archaeon GCM10025810]|uniref:GTP-dependent dephospho-CoA kinase family protein n=1 Tax=Halovalidus salilacus TaxID=3075124 RepID=UPI00360E67F8
MTRDDSTDASERSDSPDEPLLSLPDDLRGELKDPLGPIETDAAILLEGVSGPVIAVGDVVTYHLRRAGLDPDVALVDGRTKREAVDEEIREVALGGSTLEVTNPPAVITEAVIGALLEGLEDVEPTTIFVDGEEDLVALPAIVAAPDGASVVYGQPDEGMVHVIVDEEVRAEMRALLERFDGDVGRLWALLEDASERRDD